MQITPRDIEIIKFADKYGFIWVMHVVKKLGMSPRVVHRRLNLLEVGGYLQFNRIFYKQAGIYRPTIQTNHDSCANRARRICINGI